MNPGSNRLGADLLVDALKQLGVRRAFGVCADQTNALFVGLPAAGIDVIGTRNESAAVLMADGGARASGEPGVAVVGGGPGHVASVPGVAVAQSAASPVLVISGQPALHLRERNGHQILYQADMMRTLTKWALEITKPELLPEFAARGMRAAATGKPGPVSLSVPVDVMEGAVAPDSAQAAYRITPLPPPGRAAEPAPREDISAACELLANARKPFMIVGGGAWWEMRRDALPALVRRLGIPAFTMDQARGLVDDDGEICFGYAHPSFSRTFRRMAEADVILIVGAEVVMHTGAPARKLFRADSRIIQLHSDPRQMGIVRAADVAVTGTVGTTLAQIAEALVKQPDAAAAQTAWLEDIRATYAEHRGEWDRLHDRHASATDIHPIQVCRSLLRHLTPRTRVVIDGGDFVHWPRLCFPARGPGNWMDGAELGHLGGSVPVGIGAQIAAPADQTWIFVGDGGLFYYAWELATAVQYGVPVKIIVGNDSCWGVERRLQSKHYGRTVGVDLPETRFDAFARLAGAAGFRAERPEELDGAVDAFIAAPGPAVLDIRIPRDCGRPLMD